LSTIVKGANCFNDAKGALHRLNQGGGSIVGSHVISPSSTPTLLRSRQIGQDSDACVKQAFGCETPEKSSSLPNCECVARRVPPRRVELLTLITRKEWNMAETWTVGFDKMLDELADYVKVTNEKSKRDRNSLIVPRFSLPGVKDYVQ
jgi:hypothetical protein